MHRIEGIEKALNLLDTYDGQLSKTARALVINRYSLRPWRDKRKKVCTPLEVLSLYQTCRSNMPTYYAFDALHTLTTATFKCYKFTIVNLFPIIIDILFFGLLIFY